MDQTLGKRIMAARKKLGLTQDQMAEQLGVTAQAVSKWENDQSCPDITMLPRLAELFGMTTDELLGREPQRPTYEDAEIEPQDEHPPVPYTMWDRGRKTLLGVALLVLVAGGVMLANILLGWCIPVWDILWPCALLILGISGIISGLIFLRLGCILFGGYFLLENLNVIDLNLGMEIAIPVIVLLFGLSLLFNVLRKPKKVWFWAGTASPTQKSYQTDREGFTFSASFGEQEQTVNLPQLSRGEISTSFGEYRVDLSGVASVSDGCCIKAGCSFGQLTLLVPRRFRVECDNRTTFAAVDVHGQPDRDAQGVIDLHASVSFGEIAIRYI